MGAQTAATGDSAAEKPSKVKLSKADRRRQRILQCFEVEGSVKAVARKLKVSPKTVRKVLQGKPLGRSLIENPKPRESKLDPYKPVLQRLLLEDGLTAVLALEEIRELGYDGGRTIVCDYARELRPSSKRKPTTVVDHTPGAEGQVDWSQYTVELGGEQRVVHAFSVVLPWSRYIFLRFATDEQLDTLLGLHDEAFEDIDRVPPLMTYDNMTTVGRHVGPGKVWINPRFEHYAKHTGFEIRLIDPGNPNQHAPVERHFDYVENNCLRRRRFRFASFGDLQEHARWWCDHVANQRVHGTTRERPADRLVRERPLMNPLPRVRAQAYQRIERKVSRDFCVRVDNNRYSVAPKFVGKKCIVRLYDERLEVVIDGQVVAHHTRRMQPGGRHVLREHEEEFKRSTPSRHLLEQAFLRLGESAQAYHQGLVAERGKGAGYHIQRILRLADRYGSAVVLGAMAQTARYGNYSADAVAHVIAGKPPRTQDRRTGKDGLTLPPDSVRRWLEGMDVEGLDLEHFDRLLDRRDGCPDNDDEGKCGHE